MEKHYYNLCYVLYSPAESTEPDKYMAEAPDLPGCRAWGDTPEEAIEILVSLAPAFIEMRRDDDDDRIEVIKMSADSPPIRSSVMVSI